ncbi:energy transducer TonB [Solimicrobium silvestre]|uniref:TonB family C-terminal domain n=1 Tax=Solimicrobium silvestre TaxID=2099400 RepID=A0A2S9H2U7_9BURK|nr:energy transducer TonB [Solimicrobium silvestre]PRC94309.1 TonB family C-terminal domain [Solimicrobium silvestre]
MNFSEREQDPIKKMTGIFVVVVIHAIVIYALLTGLGKQIIAVIKELPIETTIIEEVKPPPPPPETPPPPPKLVEPPPPFIPVPEIQVDQPVSPNAIAATTNVQPQPSDATEVATTSTTGPSVVKAQVDFSTCDKPAYPTNSLRNEEAGVVRIQFLIGLDGRVADSKIEKSSGFKTLDVAAKKALGLCKFKPGTVDGKPQQLWTAVEYAWKLPS